MPGPVLDRTLEALSARDAEVFALWAAPLPPPPARSACAVSRVIVPEQESHEGRRGAHVHIRGAELCRIAFDNHARGERSVAQIHTHPSTDTRMSQLDVEWEVVAHPGALSIIVPDYCRGGTASFWGASVYERTAERSWRLWDAGEMGRRVRIT